MHRCPIGSTLQIINATVCICSTNTVTPPTSFYFMHGATAVQRQVCLGWVGDQDVKFMVCFCVLWQKQIPCLRCQLGLDSGSKWSEIIPIAYTDERISTSSASMHNNHNKGDISIIPAVTNIPPASVLTYVYTIVLWNGYGFTVVNTDASSGCLRVLVTSMYMIQCTVRLAALLYSWLHLISILQFFAMNFSCSPLVIGIIRVWC